MSSSDLDKERLRRALRTIASTQKSTVTAAAIGAAKVPAGYVNNEQERKIYEIKQRSKQLLPLNEFMAKYGPSDEAYGKAAERGEGAARARERDVEAAGHVAEGDPLGLHLLPAAGALLFLAWLLGFSWGKIRRRPSPREREDGECRARILHSLTVVVHRTYRFLQLRHSALSVHVVGRSARNGLSCPTGNGERDGLLTRPYRNSKTLLGSKGPAGGFPQGHNARHEHTRTNVN